MTAHSKASARPLLRALLATVLVVGALACDGSSSISPTGMGNPPICSGHPDWQSSPYVLPYPVGVAYSVLTGNCDPGHTGPNRYGYDFSMPIGSPITAMRGGTVIYVEERNHDSDHVNGTSNHLVIDHGDGTYSTYFHMTHDGIVVNVHDVVRQGQLVAYSGASGTGPAHTHVHVKECVEVRVFCESVPFTFRNTRPNPNGLQQGETYEALPFDVGAFGLWGSPATGLSSVPPSDGATGPAHPIPRIPARFKR